MRRSAGFERNFFLTMIAPESSDSPTWARMKALRGPIRPIDAHHESRRTPKPGLHILLNNPWRRRHRTGRIVVDDLRGQEFILDQHKERPMGCPSPATIRIPTRAMRRVVLRRMLCPCHRSGSGTAWSPRRRCGPRRLSQCQSDGRTCLSALPSRYGHPPSGRRLLA